MPTRATSSRIGRFSSVQAGTPSHTLRKYAPIIIGALILVGSCLWAALLPRSVGLCPHRTLRVDSTMCVRRPTLYGGFRFAPPGPVDQRVPLTIAIAGI